MPLIAYDAVKAVLCGEHYGGIGFEERGCLKVLDKSLNCFPQKA